MPGRLPFVAEAHYRRFLRIYLRDLLTLIFQVYAYCILANHFQLVVRTRYTDEIVPRLASKRSLKAYQAGFLSGERSWAEFVVATFDAATNGYAQNLTIR